MFASFISKFQRHLFFYSLWWNSLSHTNNVCIRKRHGSQCFTCVYHPDMHLAMSMVVS